MSIELFRKFGLHASADALAARDAYREGKTCRTCVHLDSDPRDEPCGTCRRFEKWQGARAEQNKAPNGVTEARRPLGCALAMRVMQSDLFQQLDDSERADCDELVRRNVEWFKADGAHGVEGPDHG